jgi:hypothetical protein
VTHTQPTTVQLSSPHPCNIRRLPLECHCNSGVGKQTVLKGLASARYTHSVHLAGSGALSTSRGASYVYIHWTPHIYTGAPRYIIAPPLLSRLTVRGGLLMCSRASTASNQGDRPLASKGCPLARPWPSPVKASRNSGAEGKSIRWVATKVLGAVLAGSSTRGWQAWVACRCLKLTILSLKLTFLSLKLTFLSLKLGGLQARARRTAQSEGVVQTDGLDTVWAN